MTREEAIADIRDNIKPIVGGKSLDMAIKALEKINEIDKIAHIRSVEDLNGLNCEEAILGLFKTVLEENPAEKQEPCKDTISREAVIDIIEDVCPIYGNDYRYILRDKVNELPPVTAEKVGHWIKLDECANSGYYCSECRKRVVKEGWSDTVKAIKYCPNCGSRMMQEVKKNEQNT